MRFRLGVPEARPWKLCRAKTYYIYRGKIELAYCTRFQGHEEKSSKQPEKHFDEYKKYSWTHPVTKKELAMMNKKWTIHWNDPEKPPTEFYAHHVVEVPASADSPARVEFYGDPNGLAGMAHKPFATLNRLEEVAHLQYPVLAYTFGSMWYCPEHKPEGSEPVSLKMMMTDHFRYICDTCGKDLA